MVQTFGTNLLLLNVGKKNEISSFAHVCIRLKSHVQVFYQKYKSSSNLVILTVIPLELGKDLNQSTEGTLRMSER
jgi:hypothetical protein